MVNRARRMEMGAGVGGGWWWWCWYWASGRKPEPTVEQRIREAFMTLSARELSEYAGTLEDKHQGFC